MAIIRYTAPCKANGDAGSDVAITGADFSALANGAGLVGPEIDNSILRFRFARLSFRGVSMPTSVSPGDGAFWEILALPEGITAGDYPDYDANPTTTAAYLPALAYRVGAIPFRSKASQSTIKGMVRKVEVPQTKFRFYAINRLINGTSPLPTSTTTMSMLAQFFNEEAA